MRDIKVDFKDRNNHYTIFIVKRLFRKNTVTVLKNYGIKEGMLRGYAEAINAEILNTRLHEDIHFWLFHLKRKIFKNRSQKCS